MENADDDHKRTEDSQLEMQGMAVGYTSSQVQRMTLGLGYTRNSIIVRKSENPYGGLLHFPI